VHHQLKTSIWASAILILGILGLQINIALAAPVNPNTPTTVAGGASSNWTNIENGCRSSIAGLCVSDANIPGQNDAYDAAAALSIDGTFYVAPSADLTGQYYTGGSAVISGLNVSEQYYFFAADSVLRTYATLNNPTGSPINVAVTWQNNLGADVSTQVITSSSGDATFGTNDEWVVTDDGNTAGGDPTTSFALYGPGAPTTTTSVSLVTQLDESGFEGVLADYNVTVPAGGTIAFMWLNGLDPDTTAGTSRGNAFPSLSPGDPLLADLGATEIARIVNWDFSFVAAPTIPVPTLDTWALLVLIAAFMMLVWVRRSSMTN